MNLRRLTGVFLINLRLCAIEILSNRVRTIITSFGIFLGVGALLSNLAFIRALEDDVRRNLEAMGGLSIVTVVNVDPVTKKERMQFQQSPGLTIQSLTTIAASMPSIRRVIEKVEMRWSPISANSKNAFGHVSAIGRDFQVAYNYQAASGRWFTEEELDRGQQVCVIGAKVADQLWGPGVDPVGKTITYAGQPFTIVGMVKGQSIRDERSTECFIPYALYTSRFAGFGRDLDEIAVLLFKSDDAQDVQRELTKNLLAAHRGVRNFEVEINKDKIDEAKATSAALQAILWCIASISLLVGGISIMNIMFATIGDRIREIGLRKALGARREDIFVQFIIEAVLVCCVGGCPGMILGAAVTLFPEGVFPFNPRLSLPDYALALGFTVAAGVLSGLSPALKAAKMEPVVALQY